jgi:hypothetical protein
MEDLRLKYQSLDSSGTDVFQRGFMLHAGCSTAFAHTSPRPRPGSAPGP